MAEITPRVREAVKNRDIEKISSIIDYYRFERKLPYKKICELFCSMANITPDEFEGFCWEIEELEQYYYGN